jgi:hypothetical protein
MKTAIVSHAVDCISSDYSDQFVQTVKFILSEQRVG